MMFREWNRTALIGVGLMAGVLQAVAGVAMYLAGVYFAPWSIFISLFVLLLCIVLGTRWYTAKYLNDEITYVQALIVGIVISVCTGLVYAVYNMVTISFFYPQFLDEVVRVRMAQAAAHQQTPESFASLRAGVSASGIAISNLIRLSIVGSFLSLLSSMFLKRRR
ncbi:MAG: DUF4199 domain-containing protein [Pyrinomonadaceae bacterium]